MAIRKLTKRVADAATPATPFTWDTELKGFGLKVTPQGKKVLLYQYRPAWRGRAGKTKRITLGEYGELTVEQARDLARQHAAEARRPGGDPATVLAAAKREKSIGELFTDLLDEKDGTVRPATLAEYRRLFERDIEPQLGGRYAAEITPSLVANWHRGMKDRPMLANRALAMLSELFGWLEIRRLVPLPSPSNPTKAVTPFPKRGAGTSLTDDQYKALGDALSLAESTGLPAAPQLARKTRGMSKARRATVGTRPRRGPYKRSGEIVPLPANPVAVAALRFLMLTGWRESEALSLTWESIDFQREVVNLRETKTGPSVRPLGTRALDLLREQPRVSGNPYAFPGALDGEHLRELRHLWEAAKHAAGIQIRLHDLRHSFVTIARDLDHGDHAIARVVGHKIDRSQTSRYGGIRDAKAKACADETSRQVAALIGLERDRTADNVLQFRSPTA
jgi:integrase